MKAPKGVKLTGAKYLKDYIFLFEFSNGKVSEVNFKPIISHGTSLLKYLDVSKFKKIKINNETGDIYWGKNWDMCFHIEAYYNETAVIPLVKKRKMQVAKLRDGLDSKLFSKSVEFQKTVNKRISSKKQ